METENVSDRLDSLLIRSNYRLYINDRLEKGCKGNRCGTKFGGRRGGYH